MKTDINQVKSESFSCSVLSDSFATTLTRAHQAPLSMGFPRQATGVFWSIKNTEAILFSRGSSQPRDRTQVSCIAGRFFIVWPSREALMISSNPRVFGPWIQLCSVMSDHKLFISSISWVYYHHFHPKVCRWTWYLCFLNLKIGFIFLKQQCYLKGVLSI